MAVTDEAATDRIRSLAEWLRARTDRELVALLQRRPDLALPAPADIPTLAARVTVRTSVNRAVDTLDDFRLAVLDGAVLLSDAGEPFPTDALAQLLAPADPESVAAAVADLRELALLWGEPDALHVAGGVREAIGLYPAGLGRPAASLVHPVPDVLTDIAELTGALAGLDADQLSVLRRLAEGPPVATLRRSGDGPGAALVARGLLIPVDGSTVELPRDVGLLLRAHPLGEVTTSAPPVPVVERASAELDRVGTTAVLESLRLVEKLGDAWSAAPPAQLRSGGVGVRELRRAARELGVDEAAAAVVVEVSVAAGLINTSAGVEPVYLPTPEFDSWRQQPPARRWADLTTAWLGMTRQPSLIGQRGERDRLITALGPDAERGTLPALRRTVLAALLELPPGAAPARRSDVLDWLYWQAPRRASGQRPVAEAILAEADLLGVTAAGGLTGYSRTLLAGSREVAEQVLDSALPAPVDSVVVQPDLTVVVPGPPTPDLAAELALVADLESTGGASVYRITEASVRRALDAGRSASDVAAMISQRSRTPLPQALGYLIDDLARRHGALRSGTAGSYLRSDDTALLTRVASDRALAPLQLRQIAPTVVISPAPVAKVLDVLRAAGYAPAAEGPAGELVTVDSEPARAPSRPPARPVRARSAVESASQLADLVKRIRAGDALSEIARRSPPLAQPVPGVTSATIMGQLRDAIRKGRRVLIGVAEADGTASRHTMLPISLGGGFVRGQQPGRPGLAAFPLHRVTAVRLVEDDAELG